MKGLPEAWEARRQRRLDRLEDYADLRALGLSREEAASQVGVSFRTAERYEAALRVEEAS